MTESAEAARPPENADAASSEPRETDTVDTVDAADAVDIEVVASEPGDSASGPREKPRTRRKSREAPPEPRVEECAELPLAGRVEAVLVASDRPLTDVRLLDILGLEPDRKAEMIEAVEAVNRSYDETHRPMRVERVAGGWQILTRSEYGPLVARTQRDRQQTRLSQAALETLAIIAYRQPVLRAEIEAIRGVSSGEVLRSLLERRLVKITGRAEELGRPMLYGTTREFLKVFGLASRDDLPEVV